MKWSFAVFKKQKVEDVKFSSTSFLSAVRVAGSWPRLLCLWGLGRAGGPVPLCSRPPCPLETFTQLWCFLPRLPWNVTPQIRHF